MRKLNGIARRSIGAFGFVTLLSTGLVAGSAVKVIASQEEQYPMQNGNFIFDNTYTNLEVVHDGAVKRSWNSEYTLESGGRTYALATPPPPTRWRCLEADIFSVRMGLSIP